MCGRYVTKDQAAIERAFADVRPFWNFKASYNVAPSQQVPVIRMSDGEKIGEMMRWGLVPFFAKGVPSKYSTINARVETLESTASYRGPWKRAQRCILPAAGFYEWHLEAGRKQPFYINLTDQEVFGFAGLWDRSIAADESEVLSCTIITMDANPLLAEIHNAKARMPAILRREDHATWLAGAAEQAKAALRQYPAELMVACGVSTRVNSPRNNDPDLVAAIATAS